jgi:hypothetical protein
MAGDDLSAENTLAAEIERKRIYDEMRFGEYEYIGPDADEYRRFYEERRERPQ